MVVPSTHHTYDVLGLAKISIALYQSEIFLSEGSDINQVKLMHLEA
jgi:hypothetical protein